jgi:hypothetical protein
MLLIGGRSVLEVVAAGDTDAYRAVYTEQFLELLKYHNCYGTLGVGWFQWTLIGMIAKADN